MNRQRIESDLRWRERAVLGVTLVGAVWMAFVAPLEELVLWAFGAAWGIVITAVVFHLHVLRDRNRDQAEWDLVLASLREAAGETSRSDGRSLGKGASS